MNERLKTLSLALALAGGWTAEFFQQGCKKSETAQMPASPTSARSASQPPGNAEQADYNLALTALDGTPVDFSQFKGKTLFLNFWATWCGPCMMEMPSIQRLYDRSKDNDALRTFVVSWENPETIRSYIARQKYSFPVYVLKKDAPKCFSSDGIPCTFIISPEGTFLKKNLGPAEWDKEPLLQPFIKELSRN